MTDATLLMQKTSGTGIYGFTFANINSFDREIFELKIHRQQL